MDFSHLLRALRRSWWLIAAFGVSALGVAALSTALTTPLYASSLTFFVTTSGEDISAAYQGGLFSQQRVTSYADLIRGDRLATMIAHNSGSGLTPAQIQQRLSARPVPETVLLEVTVTDSSLERSEVIANALATQFGKLVRTIETPPGANTAAIKVEVVTGPTRHSVPVSPKPVRNLGLGLIFGLLAGVASAVLRETLDKTVKSSEVLQQATGAPALALVPYESEAARTPILLAEGYSARAEALRQLRTNLQFVDVDRPIRVLVITSAVPSEGKSTTSVNLAIAFAEAGKRVLVIEADLRRPTIATYLGLEGAVGLSNVLAGQVTVEDALQRWGEHDLWVLPSGFIPPNPSEILGSRNMSVLLERQREEFDVIIIDTPPVLPVTDAAVVAAMADGAVLVVRAAKTSQDQAKAAATALSVVDARLLGCVLNGVRRARGATQYYYYYDRKIDGQRKARTASRQPKQALPPRHDGVHTHEPATGTEAARKVRPGR